MNKGNLQGLPHRNYPHQKEPPPTAGTSAEANKKSLKNISTTFLLRMYS